MTKKSNELIEAAQTLHQFTPNVNAKVKDLTSIKALLIGAQSLVGDIDMYLQNGDIEYITEENVEAVLTLLNKAVRELE